MEFIRATVLPEAGAGRKPDAIYAVKAAGQTTFDLFITGSTPEKLFSLTTHEEIRLMINQSVSGMAQTFNVPELRERDYLVDDGKLTKDGLVFVDDATLDPDIESGGAAYHYSVADNSFTELFRYGASSEGQLTWQSITGGPLSSPAAIDKAVQDSHTHTNKDTLDRIGYAGAKVGVVLTVDDTAVGAITMVTADW